MLTNLPQQLRHAYRGSNVEDRVARYAGWLEGVRRIDAPAGYDHPETVNDYYDL